MVNNDQRRRQLAREKFERQQQRRAERQRRNRRRTAVIGAALAVVVAGTASACATGLFESKNGEDGKVVDAAPGAPSKKADPCKAPAPGQPAKLSFDKEPPLTVDKSAKYAMKLRTTCGDIDLQLDAQKAPRTVNSFHFLAGKGYFDHTKCHRLTTQGIHVLQCGDPTAAGSGTPGYKLPDENLKDPKVAGGTYPAGTVAMANAGPGTGGSQFFLVYKDSPLPPNYTPFGTITGGQDVLEKIAGAGESSGQGDGAPNATVVIDKATVTK
ncbi:peptidylprolyl isomerase [Streptomyces candidus]|uniref:Peptidyl-prolyl cis-trans isomerase n=1 Tax=Streptomyces candidus TaxID=67283 RepID=A0A7X0LQV0_9ACTN|nr:peptidylprolyl isomerase [Streptomyces candidus]MBB6436306.1 peptidyl-prolyl cis-trans isomerase B (cyclophilin B) [Streptomyces candidus]GHH48480.1 peptidyl-prolyl cis-trans isomerase [Streptomyces candidus]